MPFDDHQAVGEYERGNVGEALRLYEAAYELNGADERVRRNLLAVRTELEGGSLAGGYMY